MAYAALTSLANTIDHFLNDKEFSLPPGVKPQFLSLQNHVTSFQAFLVEFPDKYGNLEERMRELANETEESIEKLAFVEVCSSSEDESESHQTLEMCWCQFMDAVIEEINSIATEIKDTFRSTDVQDCIDSLSSSTSVPTIHKDFMVGFEDHVIDVKDRLCGQHTKLQVIPIYGMGGIGKTTLAKSVYDDPLIMESFQVRVWVTISQDYSQSRVLSSLLESLKEFNMGGLGQSEGEKVYKILKGRKFFVVMDDIWSREAWDGLRKVFPDDGKGSRILLTTRLSEVASYPSSSNDLFEMQLMDDNQSWNLFKKKVFKEGDCPSELESSGKEVARSCKGLPLAIVVIAGLLSTVDANPSSWKKIVENVKSAGSAKQGKIEDILSLSYLHLPQYLRPCFLYMGSFPEDDEIRVSKLIKLWVAEGFLKSPNNSRTLEEEAERCLEDLVKRSLVLVTKRRSDGSRIKSCSLHDLMRDLCIRKAHESKFLVNLIERNVEKESFMQRIENNRCISIDTSSLVHFSSFDESNIRTIRCSKYHEVDLDFLENVGSLRVLDAESADVKSLPYQLFRLSHLRFLAVRHEGLYFNSFSCLKNLQTLIIKQRYVMGGRAMHLELWLSWCMPQLRHVYFHGRIKLTDPGTDCSLQSLQTVSYVSFSCCTEKILKSIPNLRKLKIRCFDNKGNAVLNGLVHLHRLVSLVIYGRRYCKFSLPEMLKRLSLIDLKLAWNEIFIVGSLPNLQVLKLKHCTCVGKTWETIEGAFPVLEVLVIESVDFRAWKTESSHFPRLKRLLLHSCENLIEIPNDIGEIPTLELIELKGRVRKSLVLSAKRIQEEQQEEWGNYGLQVHYIELS